MMTDPVSDMLTRIRNANLALHERVAMPASKLKEEIAKILAAEGYIEGYEVTASGTRKTLDIKLKYTSDRVRVIEGLRRISTPGRRIYAGADALPRVNGGLGVAVVSTSQGLLPDREARRRRLGGEIVCEVW
ncbi:MAG TPA: 30S ribosomal protein S8 [Acidimicrobiia bacterium]|nr:30S ribosomal protein S8 [Acidimicrobiia bacterium]